MVLPALALLSRSRQVSGPCPSIHRHLHTRGRDRLQSTFAGTPLLRPRDPEPSEIGLPRLTTPDERGNEHRLKEAVNEAATEIAHEYLAEIRAMRPGSRT